ncbi:MAG: fluoride efflux transporter CrcB [Candidatus Accumulibacter sp.]|jgi:CrcB protein|nr:fluoride efflux transporter CrcB [Accumulibacter sp.]
MWISIPAVAVGAAFGALVRWQLGRGLNALFPSMPPGTLLANLAGAFVAGFCAVALSREFSPEWRLFAITGFCGGLTTFSTFSLEVVGNLQHGKPALALCTVAVHVAGSLLMAFAGICAAHFLKSVS